MLIRNDEDAIKYLIIRAEDADENAHFICYTPDWKTPDEPYHPFIGEECHGDVTACIENYTKCITTIESRFESFYKWLIEDSFFSYLFNQDHDWRKTSCAILEFDLSKDIVPLRIALMLTRLPWDQYRGSGDVFDLMEKINKECGCGYWFAYLFTSFLNPVGTQKMAINTHYTHHVPFAEMGSFDNINRALSALSTEQKLSKALKQYPSDTCSLFIDNVLGFYQGEVIPFMLNDFSGVLPWDSFVQIVNENKEFI